MGCAVLPLLTAGTALAALRQGILVCLAGLIAAPLIWLSGGAVMQMTAHAWLTSPAYLVGLLCLVVALLVSWRGEGPTKTVFVLLFVGMILSRMTFFGDTVSTIANIGHLY